LSQAKYMKKQQQDSFLKDSDLIDKSISKKNQEKKKQEIEREKSQYGIIDLNQLNLGDSNKPSKIDI